MKARSPPTATQPAADTTPSSDAPMPVPNGAATSTPVWPHQKYCVIRPATGSASLPEIEAGGGGRGRAGPAGRPGALPGGGAAPPPQKGRPGGGWPRPEERGG